MGPGVQEYISCRTRPYGGGSGEGGGQAGGWAPLGSAHCWSGAGFQQRRHLCCAHRLSRPKGTPVAPQPPKRKSLHISPFLPHTLPLRQGRIQNSQSTSVMLSWSAIALSAVHFTAAETQKSWQPCCRLDRWLGGPIAGAFSSARLPSRAHRAQATSSGVQGQRRRMRKKPPCQGGEQHNTVNTCLSSVFCRWGQIRANVSLSQLRLPYVTLG